MENDDLFGQCCDFKLSDSLQRSLLGEPAPEETFSLPLLTPLPETDQLFDCGWFVPPVRPAPPEQIYPEPMPSLPPGLPFEKTLHPAKRYQAMGWFLTYPQCDLSPQEALECLKKLPYPIKDYIIAKEEHKDGSPHLHAFIRYHKKVDWTPTRWNLYNYHGDYQGAKSWNAVMKYCTKGGNYISNIDVKAAETKKAARNKQLLEDEPQKLVEEGFIGVMQLPQLLKAKAAYSLLKPAVQTVNVRGVWIWGKTGIGKSYLVRELFQGRLYLKSQSKWWDGYSAQEVVLIDDYDIRQSTTDKPDSLVQAFGHYLKIWADRYSCTGEQKGATINLHHRLLIITSNYSPHHCFWTKTDNELVSAITRRFKLFQYDMREQYPQLQNSIRAIFESNTVE